MLLKRSPRLYHNVLNKFKLELSLNIAGSEFFGILGDLSEDGLCAVIPVEDGSMLATENGGEVHGSILGKDLREELKFDARIAWQEMATFKGKHSFLLGIEFIESVKLPEVLQETLLRVASKDRSAI
ncbi:MAG: PilZ domain-containing protein [bacterium]|nr:PilZ domain-containing protein [bacterium]